MDGKKRVINSALLLVVGIGVGWLIRTNRVTATDGLSVEPVVAVNLTEDDLAKIFEEKDNQKRRQAAHRLFSRLGASEMRRFPQLIDKFSYAKSEEGDEDAWSLADEFYRRWGEIAPKDALEFLAGNKSYWAGLSEAVYFSWAKTDPDTAIAAYDPALESQYSSEIQDAILEGLSSVDPAKALTFADAQEIGHDGIFFPENRAEIQERYSSTSDFLDYVPVETPSDPFGLSIYLWIHRDPEAALVAMLPLKYGLLKQGALGALFSNWLLRDPDQALAALPRIEDRWLRESTIHTAMQAYLMRHPSEALKRILEIPEFEDEDPESPLPFRFCETYGTSTFGRIDLVSEAAVALGVKNGKRAWDTSAAIHDDNKRAAALGGALAGWLISDTDEAVEFAGKGIRDGSLVGSGGADFPRFAASLVAKMLAHRDFGKTKAWVSSLPPGEMQDGAIDTAARMLLDIGWHKALKEGTGYPEIFLKVQIREFAPVADWLASLPMSKGRDGGIYWLVFQMREHDDTRPALNLAAMIRDQRLRQLTLESLAKMFFEPTEKPKTTFDFQAWAKENPEFAKELTEVWEAKNKE